jgi:hypothetical protein
MKKILFGVLALMLVFSASAVWAAGFEFTPFIGGMFNANLDVTNAPYTRLQLKKGLDWGFNVGGDLGEHLGAEFMYNRVNQQLIRKDTDERLFNLNTSNFEGNMLYNFGARESKFRPYALVGLGITHFNPHSRDIVDLSGVSKFNWDLAGGVKAYFSPHFGIRGELRFVDTYLSTNADGIFCSNGFCAVDNAQNWLQQWDFTVGAIIRM